jgi:RNA polymerase sigma-70 factor (ECF subfamily)
MNSTICWFADTTSDPMAHESQELTRGLRQRDPDLLDSLIEQFRFRLFRYLLYLTNHRETAEELFQETWVRVIERGHQYNQKWKFEAWLFTIARNLVIDLQRRRQPRYVDLLSNAGDEEGTWEIEAPGQSSALDLLAQREEGERVGAALAGLPATYREVLVLRFQEDMTLEEIAAVVAAPLPTIKSRLYRGLEAVRQILERVEP